MMKMTADKRLGGSTAPVPSEGRQVGHGLGGRPGPESVSGPREMGSPPVPLGDAPLGQFYMGGSVG